MICLKALKLIYIELINKVGRAGRFNTAGISVTFTSSEDEKKVLKDIEEKYNITIAEFPTKIEENELCKIIRRIIIFMYEYIFMEVFNYLFNFLSF